jgi:hypothetical protein
MFLIEKNTFFVQTMSTKEKNPNEPAAITFKKTYRNTYSILVSLESYEFW